MPRMRLKYYMTKPSKTQQKFYILERHSIYAALLELWSMKFCIMTRFSPFYLATQEWMMQRCFFIYSLISNGEIESTLMLYYHIVVEMMG